MTCGLRIYVEKSGESEDNITFLFKFRTLIPGVAVSLIAIQLPWAVYCVQDQVEMHDGSNNVQWCTCRSNCRHETLSDENVLVALRTDYQRNPTH